MNHLMKKTISILLVVATLLCCAPLSGVANIELPEFGGFKKLASSVSDFFDGFAPKAEAVQMKEGFFTYESNGVYANIKDCDVSISGNVKIPSSLGGYIVKRINPNAFADCTNITSIVIPEEVITIGRSAFRNCKKLEKVIIPDSISHIDLDAFYGCTGLLEFEVGKNNEYYMNDSQGALIDKRSMYLIRYPIASRKTTYCVPDGVKHINQEAFQGSKSLKNVELPDSVESIGISAFKECTNLVKIDIPDTVNEVGSRAFESCINLTDVSIGDGVAYIKSYTFLNCINLKNVIMGKSIEAIESYSFKDCAKLSFVDFSNCITTIGYEAFANCANLRCVELSCNLKTIEGSAFDGCINLSEITIPDCVIEIGQFAFGNTAFYNNDSNWDEGVLYIGNHLIDVNPYHSAIKGTYKIKQGTKCIADHAFSSSRELTNIIIPDSVTSIGDTAFSYCIGITSIVIPKSVKKIGESSFAYCEKLKSITILGDISDIGSHPFDGTAYYLDDSNWCDNVLYISKYLVGVKEEISGNYKIKPGTRAIAHSAFMDCEKLESVVIPNGITCIPQYLFDGCDSLESITIPKSVKVIETLSLENSIINIFYTGTKEEWAEILIDKTNNISRATIHYNTENENSDVSILEKVSTYPENNATAISSDDDLIITFNQPIDNSFYFETDDKELSIRNYYTDEPVLILNDKNYLDYWSLIDFSENIITISDIFRKICPGEKYYITISSGIISAEDDFSKTFAGITDKDSWTFTYSEESEKKGYSFEVYSSRSSFNMNKGEIMNSKVVLTYNGDICGQSGVSYTIGDSSVAKVKSMTHDESGTTFVIEALNYGVTNIDIIYVAGALRESFMIKVADEKTIYYLNDIKGRSQGDNPFYTCGLYVDSLDYMELADGRASVSFDVYNSSNCYGAVEVHNASGDLVDCEMIDMFDGEYNTDFVSYGIYAYKVGRDTFNGDLFDNDVYKTEVKTQKTRINVSVPKGGYIVVTKNVSQSMPCLLYNVTLLAIEASTSLAKFTTKIETSSDLIKEILEATAEKVTWKKIACEITSEAAKSTVKDFIKAANETNILAMLEATEGIYKDLDDIYDIFEIDWEDLVLSTLKKVAPNIAVEFVTGFALDKLGGNIVDYFFFGPIGIAKHLVMLGTICDYTDVSGTYIYNSQKGETRYSNKVIANSTSIQDDVVFHSVLIKSGKLDDVINYYTGTYEEAILYDISLIKNGNKIQPKEKVQVSIPIPDGWSASDITVHHEVAYQKYEKLEVIVEDGYIVFYTDSFSDFIIANGNIEINTYNSKPDAPVFVDKDNKSIKVEKVENVEFSIDNGLTWNESGVFTGLQADTTYVILSRFVYDKNVQGPGKLYGSLEIRTNFCPSYSADIKNVKFTTPEGLHYADLPLEIAVNSDEPSNAFHNIMHGDTKYVPQYFTVGDSTEIIHFETIDNRNYTASFVPGIENAFKKVSVNVYFEKMKYISESGSNTLGWVTVSTGESKTYYVKIDGLSKVCDHNFVPSVTVPATCTENGVMTYTCECGDSFTEEIPATGHVPGSWNVSIPASCTVDGESVLCCEECGIVLGNKNIPATGHVPGFWVIVVEPTTETEGSKIKCCDICGDLLEEESIPKLPPEEPVKDNAVVKNPSTSTISYGDAIILHVDASKIPEGGYVEWTADNGNFSYKPNDATCEISPKKSGDTTFTATIYDANGNAVSTDEQTMTAKAGFFDKIIAFFKGLFGLSKTYPSVFKGIF